MLLKKSPILTRNPYTWQHWERLSDVGLSDKGFPQSVCSFPIYLCIVIFKYVCIIESKNIITCKEIYYFETLYIHKYSLATVVSLLPPFVFLTILYFVAAITDNIH